MRSVLRFVTWRLSLASPAVDFYSVCIVCAEASPTVHSAKEKDGPEEWAIQHTAKNPSHRAFRAYQVSAWRTEPDDTVGHALTS
ncbi:hypothetical protein ACF1B4_09815 [Streptomyces albidoflavus]